MLGEFQQVDTLDLMKLIEQSKLNLSKHSTLLMNQWNIVKKTDLKEEVTIKIIIQLVKHLNKNLKNSGLMPKTKS
jgi:hypothetical protein